MNTPPHQDSFNVLSLFSGIDGLGLGLQRAGMTIVGHVEIDPFCRQVLARHWPGVPQHDDVRTAGDWWRSTVRPTVDLVAGGFQCQPFSLSGNKLGIGDERWGWPWMRDVIAMARPRYVLIENVPALLGDAEAFGWVLRDLSRLRFDAEWSVVSACALGAPHTRERLFVLAYPAGSGLGARGGTGPGPSLLEPHGRSEEPRWPGPSESRPHGVAYGVPGGVHRRKALGNAVVPQVAELIGRRVLAMDLSAAAAA